MRKALLFVAAFLGYAAFSHAQETPELPPYSSLVTLSAPDQLIQTVVLPELDMDRIEQEDEVEAKTGNFERFGEIIPVNFNLHNSGTWTLLPGGDKIWRIRIHSPRALALIPYFDAFYLPEGARLHFYNEEKNDIQGAFTSLNNNEAGTFASWYVHGETMIIEYYEPLEVAGQGVLNLEGVSHAYRFVQPFIPVEERGSDPCQVNVNCSEGANWIAQRDAVMRIIVRVGSATGYCTGAVVNNTNRDCKPYVLTALHCGVNSSGTLASASNFNQWVFRFNYQRSACSSGSSGVSQTVTGAQVRAHSNDGGGDRGSDFLLVELNNAIPSGYNPYYAGWDANTTASSSGVSIHHPSGDIKKISTYNAALVSTTWGGPSGTHWRVRWIATANGHGVTEGGSSGSPIFNASKLICGTLTGGSSYCSATSSPDLYGKMSYHWTSNGSVAAHQLKPWLDPANTGQLTLSGTYAPCNSPSSVEERSLESVLLLYPNPAQGVLNVQLTESGTLPLQWSITNMLGQMQASGVIPAGSRAQQLEVSGYTPGIYFVTLTTGKQRVTRKVMIE